MYLCSNCRERLSDLEPDASTPFPAWTVAAGTLASVAAAATGALLLIPAALVAGALADKRPRRCDICHAGVDETDSGYRLMSEHKENSGSRSYRPLRQSANEDHEAGQYDTRALHDTLSDQSPQMARGPESMFASPHDSPFLEPPSSYVFDEVQGLLVPQDPNVGNGSLDVFSSLDGEAGIGLGEASMTDVGESAGGFLTELGSSMLDGIESLIDKLPFGDSSS